MKREEINIVALGAVLEAMYGPGALAAVSNAYLVAVQAVDVAFNNGYDEGYLDADPQNAFMEGWRRGQDFANTVVREPDAVADTFTGCNIEGTTNAVGQKYDVALGLYVREWLRGEGYGGEENLMTMEFMDGYWAAETTLEGYFHAWAFAELDYPAEVMEDLVREFISGWMLWPK